MTEQIDYNKIMAELISKNAKDIITNLVTAGKDVLKGTTDAVRLHISKTYEGYLNYVLNKYLKTKSFFVRDEPVYLYSFYTPLGVMCGKRKMDKAYIEKMIFINRRLVITGSGGSGKSILMRHLFIDTINKTKKIPVFIELRELNQTEKGLVDIIRERLKSNRLNFDDAFLEKAFAGGNFAFFLDGFDEVASSLRNNLTKQIQELTEKYDECVVIVSSRPDSEFVGWSEFSIVKINSLTVSGACELINKLNYDETTKTKFIQELTNGLFQKHLSFLSNPLLLSIMLLTYGMNADIPNKLNVFYSQAYEALFQRHDALKGTFQRERRSKLDSQDFSKVFSAFCVQTYDKRKFDFSESEAIDLLEKSKKLVGITFDSNSYLKDALQAVCLLLEDGLFITFPHRSFQEYFTARFIYESKLDKREKLIARYAKNILMDSVINLLYEMDAELIERTLIIPGVEKLGQQLNLKGDHVQIEQYLNFLQLEWSTFYVYKDNPVEGAWQYGLEKKGNGYFSALLQFTLFNCGYLINWNGFGPFEFPLKENIKLSIDELIAEEEFIKVFLSGTHLWSFTSFAAVFWIKEVLIKKHQKTEQSLEEILDI